MTEEIDPLKPLPPKEDTKLIKICPYVQPDAHKIIEREQERTGRSLGFVISHMTFFYEQAMKEIDKGNLNFRNKPKK